MTVRELTAEEAGRRFQAVLEASRRNKKEAAKTLGVSASAITRLLQGKHVREASSKQIALKMEGVGYLAADATAIWHFLEGVGSEDEPPLRQTSWLVERSSQPTSSQPVEEFIKEGSKSPAETEEGSPEIVTKERTPSPRRRRGLPPVVSTPHRVAA